MLSAPPTPAELDALPYGVASGLVGSETPADLDTLDAVGNSEGSGLTAAEYRSILQEFGESVRIWQGFAAINLGQAEGTTQLQYVELAIPDEVQVRIWYSKQDVMTQEWGQIKAGTAMIATMPDELVLSRYDRVCRVSRAFHERAKVTPSGGATDPLPRRFIASIVSVRDEVGLLLPSAYAVSMDGGGITWTGAPPTGDVLVAYTYRPIYEWLGEEEQEPPRGTDGGLLPRIGPLRWLSVGEEGKPT